MTMTSSGGATRCISPNLLLRRSNRTVTLLLPRTQLGLRPLQPPLRLLPHRIVVVVVVVVMHMHAAPGLTALQIRGGKGLVVWRCGEDDVPGVQQTRHEAEEAQGEVYERVGGA